MIVTLKDKNKEIKKLETFKKKIEDRYKERVKQGKEVFKDKTVLEDALRALVSQSKHSQLFDKEGKLVADNELIVKLVREESK